jgi:hypothetical protein
LHHSRLEIRLSVALPKDIRTEGPTTSFRVPLLWFLAIEVFQHAWQRRSPKHNRGRQNRQPPTPLNGCAVCGGSEFTCTKWKAGFSGSKVGLYSRAEQEFSCGTI